MIQLQHWGDYDRYLIVYDFGSITLDLFPSKQNWGGTSWISNLYVCPEHRRQGHAKDLLNEVEKLAIENGHFDLWLAYEIGTESAGIYNYYRKICYDPIQETSGLGYITLQKQLQE